MSVAKPIVVTGAAGFIGAYLVRKLLTERATTQIICVDEIPYFTERLCTKTFADQVKCLSPDAFLQDYEVIDPGLVFHMGACSNTEESREDYIRRMNLEYSQQLWRRAADNGAALIYASSAGTYGLGEHGFSDDPAHLKLFEPLSLYAQSKHNFDLWVLTQKKAPQQWAGFKFFNVYGPGEDHKGRQASMALHLRKQVLEQGQVRLYKSYKKDFRDGEQLRDFVYVGDVAKVMLDFAKHERKNGIYNLGSGEARSFLDLAEAVAAALGKKIDIKFIEMPESLRAQYQYFTQADLGRLRAAAYTQPFLSLEAGVRAYFSEGDFQS